ncbi:MAG: molecular chaperone Tir [Ruminococcus sp.]|nr:molecular chaperone Tir [Ruminococcus sp.]
MVYRTRIYIAADWESDKNAVDRLIYWNNNNYWGLSFRDAHELSQCRSDSTNNCNIKKNCSQNLDHSKGFVLIVGSNTKYLRAGYCMYCKKYNYCPNTYKENKSFVEFECDYAKRNNLPIIVLYNSTYIDKHKCIDSVVNIAKCHVPMLKREWNGQLMWDYQSVKKAFEKLGE